MRDMWDEPKAESSAIVVLGLGNVLRRDEGLGIRALQRLQERFAPIEEVQEEVQFVDGGTLGLELLAYLEDARRLLVLDAVLTEGPPGALIRLASADVPAFLGMRSSPHEIGLADLLAVLRLRELEPEAVVVLGMQPEVIELGWELSPVVSARLDSLVDMAVSELEGWGVSLTARDPMEATVCTK